MGVDKRPSADCLCFHVPLSLFPGYTEHILDEAEEREPYQEESPGERVHPSRRDCLGPSIFGLAWKPRGDWVYSIAAAKSRDRSLLQLTERPLILSVIISLYVNANPQLRHEALALRLWIFNNLRPRGDHLHARGISWRPRVLRRSCPTD